jgi:hypothetical protein
MTVDSLTKSIYGYLLKNGPKTGTSIRGASFYKNLRAAVAQALANKDSFSIASNEVDPAYSADGFTAGELSDKIYWRLIQVGPRPVPVEYIVSEFSWADRETIYSVLNDPVRFYSITAGGAARFGARPKAAPPSEEAHPLSTVFNEAVLQATKGKGVRHGGDSIPFMDQPWHELAKQYGGLNGLLFQAAKKMGESVGKPDQETFERELLGAMVYAGMAFLYVREHGYKPPQG